MGDVDRWAYHLTNDEAACARVVARRRRGLNGGQTNLAAGEHQSDLDRLKNDYHACIAEIGASRILNLAWTGCGKGAYGVPDVGGKYEVRSITSLNKGLLINDSDKNKSRIYILTYVYAPHCAKLLGWETGTSIVLNGIHRNSHTPKPYWTLPIENLKSMDTLI